MFCFADDDLLNWLITISLLLCLFYFYFVFLIWVFFSIMSIHLSIDLSRVLFILVIFSDKTCMQVSIYFWLLLLLLLFNNNDNNNLLITNSHPDKHTLIQTHTNSYILIHTHTYSFSITKSHLILAPPSPLLTCNMLMYHKYNEHVN